MFDLMQMGLAAQQATVDANKATQYTRIVQPQELFSDVFYEAIEHRCFVWSNGRKTIISDRAPHGFVKVDHNIINNLQDEA